MNWLRLLTFGFIVNALFACVNAGEVELPVLNEHVCPSSGYILEHDSLLFRHADGHRSALRPIQTFLGGHEYRYAYSSSFSYGDTLYFHGHVSDPLNTIEINIIATQPVHADDSVRVFHFKVLFDQGFIALNTHQNGWGDEEQCPIPKDLTAKKPFILKFHIAPDGYLIVLNGRQIYSYRHRLPPNINGAVTVSGGVTLTKIRKGGPLLKPHIRIPLRLGLAIGDRLFISGLADRETFSIVFLASNEEVTLEFVFDFNNKKVHCYEHQDGALARQVDGDGFPLIPGIEFNMDFMPSADGMTLALMDRFYGNFKHVTNIPELDYSYLLIRDHVTIYDLEICPHK